MITLWNMATHLWEYINKLELNSAFTNTLFLQNIHFKFSKYLFGPVHISFFLMTNTLLFSLFGICELTNNKSDNFFIKNVAVLKQLLTLKK